MQVFKNKITSTDYYFPLWFSILTSIGGVVVIALTLHPALSLLCIAINVVLWTTQYHLTISLDEKTYSDYLFLAGFKLNEVKVKFEGIDRIYITKEKITHSYRSRGSNRDASWVEYTASIVFVPMGVQQLWTETSKDDLLPKTQELAKFCKVGIEIRTQPEWYWLDPSTT